MGTVTAPCIDLSMQHVASVSNVTLVIDKHHWFELHYMTNHTFAKSLEARVYHKQ